MTQPPEGPADLERVKALLKIDDDDDDVALLEDVAAVNDMVRDLPVAQLTGDAVEAWPDRVTRGADALAARLFRRRSTPSGVETFGEFGPVYVRRNDPDVAMLLKLGDYAAPAVG